MNNKEPGYVYILTRSTSGRLHICKNPSFREDWVKIGKSSRPVDVRSKELDNTFVPLSFEKRAQRFLPLLRPKFRNPLTTIRLCQASRGGCEEVIGGIKVIIYHP